MTNIRLISCYLGIEVSQKEDYIFILQSGFAKDILKKFKMENRNPIKTQVEVGIKLCKDDNREKVDSIEIQRIVDRLRYLTCTRADILYAVGLVSRYMESPTMLHWNAAKRILRYIKGTTNYSLFYSNNDNFRLVGY
ncbi:Retrovirus-related Pol polyprotein from transposon RE2 [Linum grandiflorum]